MVITRDWPSPVLVGGGLEEELLVDSAEDFVVEALAVRNCC